MSAIEKAKQTLDVNHRGTLEVRPYPEYGLKR